MLRQVPPIRPRENLAQNRIARSQLQMRQSPLWSRMSSHLSQEADIPAYGEDLDCRYSRATCLDSRSSAKRTGRALIREFYLRGDDHCNHRAAEATPAKYWCWLRVYLLHVE